jgi:ABC-type sugar transport systems, permease components
MMKTLQKYKSPLLFLAPSLVLLLVFFYIPMLASLFVSLTNFNIFSLADWSKAGFIGLGNYSRLFQDPLFTKCILNTLYYTVMAVPLLIILPLILAVLLNRAGTYFKNLFRVGYFLPSLTDTIAIAVVWNWVASKDVGLINLFLHVLGIKGPGWLSDVHIVMFTVVMLGVWKGLGYNTVLYLAGLQSIPGHLYEVATIDGANSWQQFRHITLPLVRPVSFFITIMGTITALQLFGEPLTLTNGGPMDATKTIVIYLYENGFTHFNMGYASAVSYVLVGFIFVVTVFQFKFRDKDINY